MKLTQFGPSHLAYYHFPNLRIALAQQKPDNEGRTRPTFNLAISSSAYLTTETADHFEGTS
jgi:hypothetical protein